MKSKDDFYIGWKKSMSKSGRKYLLIAISLIFILAFSLVYGVIYFQKPFNNHQFQLGKLTTISGRYHDTPVPMLIANPGQLPADISKTIMLVGYGKMGAEGIMDKIMSEHGDLDGRSIEMQGSLIYGDGRTILELLKRKAL